MNKLEFTYSRGGKFDLALASDEKITTNDISTMSTYIYMLFNVLKQVSGSEANADVEAFIRDIMKGDNDPHCD